MVAKSSQIFQWVDKAYFVIKESWNLKRLVISRDLEIWITHHTIQNLDVFPHSRESQLSLKKGIMTQSDLNSPSL